MKARFIIGGRERGVVLFISLVVLVLMTIAGMALIRSAGSGVLIAGNLGFKRAATIAGDLGVELGRQWLVERSRSGGDPLATSDAGNGYLAGWSEGFDPASHDWNAQSGPLRAGRRGATDAHENDVRYVIHRLCAGEGPANTERCVSPPGGANSSNRVLAYTDPSLSGGSQVAYRVTTRVVGARGNTVSYTQAIIFN